LQRVDLCREQPELVKEFAGLYGKVYLAELQQQDRDKAVKEIEAVFEQATERYGEVKLSGSETVAERAKVELFEIRNLSVGKEALDIEGEDQHSKRFKLSDYRGKVVLLDFWSYVWGKKRCQGEKGVRNRFSVFWDVLGAEVCSPDRDDEPLARTMSIPRMDNPASRTDAMRPTPPPSAAR
jgi:hypothetical protein